MIHIADARKKVVVGSHHDVPADVNLKRDDEEKETHGERHPLNRAVKSMLDARAAATALTIAINRSHEPSDSSTGSVKR